jgi:hypothetical protein
MPRALADFFFIAGLEGHEPAILNAGGHYTSSSLRDDKGIDVSSVQKTIEEGSPSSFNIGNIDTHRQTSIGNDEHPSPSSAAHHSTQRLSSPVSEFSFERETNFSVFEDVMAKFTSERDEFLSRLAPPLIPLTRPTPPQWQSTPHTANEDHLSEQNHVDDVAPSSFRRRSTLRTKLADLSRRTSRAGNLRRANTIGCRTVYLANNSISKLKPLFGDV